MQGLLRKNSSVIDVMKGNVERMNCQERRKEEQGVVFKESF